MKKIVLLINALLTSIILNAQSDSFFVGTKIDSLYFSNEYKEIETRYKKEVDELKGEFKKEYKEIFAERFDNIKYHFTEKRLLTNKPIQTYLQQMMQEVIKANPELQSSTINIFFKLTEVPNAAFVGENTIVFNTGLFHRLHNESQVVFVLCHELAHLYLNHGNKQIEKYVTTVYSKEFQKELKSIQKAEYKQKEKLEKLALGLKLDNRRHSRYKESEADSLAIVFMSKTNFDIKESLGLLKVLDELDNDTLNTTKSLQSNFNSNAFPFKQKWLDKEEGLLGGHADIKEDDKLADSLKTHPDCKKRIEVLSKMLDKFNQTTSQKNYLNPSLFNQLTNQFKLENIAYYIDKKLFDNALYYSLKAINEFPENPYIITSIGNIFNQMYEAQMKHRLGLSVSMPSPDNSKSFNTLLQFIQNLDTEDYKNISYNFLSKYTNLLSSYIQYTNAVIESQKK